jgi:hypothetical protein
MRSHSDPLKQLNHLIVQIKFVVLETVSLVVFLAVVYAVVKHELGL